MKKFLITILLFTIGLSLSAQNLYVQPIGAEYVTFVLADKPKITFAAGSITVAEQTFQLNNIQNLSFVVNTNEEETCDVCENDPCTCGDEPTVCDVCENDPCTCEDEPTVCDICENDPCTCNDDTSIEKLSTDNQISVFPNPVKDELLLSVQNLTQGLNYRLLDMSGRQLKTDQIRSETTKIDMQNFQTGTYVLIVGDNNQHIQSFKIVKQ